MRPQSLLSPFTLQPPQLTACNTKECRVLDQAQVLWRGIKRWGLLKPANTQEIPSLAPSICPSAPLTPPKAVGHCSLLLVV